MHGPFSGLCRGFRLQGCSRTLRRSRNLRRPDRGSHTSKERSGGLAQTKMTGRNLRPAPVRPPAFAYRSRGILRLNVVLHCDQVPLTALAERYGTPLYVYSASMIHERYETFDTAFGQIPHTICYSVKANSNLSILKLLSKQGCG